MGANMQGGSFGTLLVELGFVTNAQLDEAIALRGDRVTEALLELGHITHAQLREALDAIKSTARPKLGDVLVNLGYLTKSELESVLQIQATSQRPLGELLIESGACTYEEVFEGLRAQSTGVLKRVRVLVVDDSLIVCTLLTQGLMDLGYHVVSRQDPVKALDDLDHIQPDIVVSDLEMPNVDGAELCRRIKTRTTDQLPVIILTANETEAALTGLQAGADDYVRKGTSMEELGARIETIMRRTKATERVRKLFARYTSDAVVDQVLQAGTVVLTGEKREVTVVFVDVRGFTTFAESETPEAIVSTLNDVLGRLADAVLAQGGTIDKFLGDGLMAVFGAPMKQDDDTQRALAAAARMLAAMDERNAACEPELVLDVGIGINTGMVVAGSIGNERRSEYTVIGDTVNVASRLCALAEPGEILVGAGTVRRIGNQAGFDEMEPVRLKGKLSPVPVFRMKRS
jgi:adenylate cyclase